MVRDIILKQKKELEQKLNEKYVRRDTSIQLRDFSLLSRGVTQIC